MNKPLIFTGTAATAAIIATSALALTIDTFDREQYTQDDPTAVIPNSVEMFDASALGGWRDVAASNDQSVRGGTQATVDATGRGRFSVSNASETSGNGTLTYDGMDGSADADMVDVNGLGGLDLTDGMTSNFFSFDVVATDAPFTYKLSVWDDNSTAFFDGMIGENVSNGKETIAFSNFAGIDFTQIGAIQLSFSGTDAGDLSIDNFMTAGDAPAVPLPASLPLLLLGVGGIAALKRRAS